MPTSSANQPRDLSAVPARVARLNRADIAGRRAISAPESPGGYQVPTHQDVRADGERLPPRSPQKPAGRSQEDTVGVLQTRASDLPAKNRNRSTRPRERTPKNRYASDASKGSSLHQDADEA